MVVGTPWITAGDLAARPDVPDSISDSGVLTSAAADASYILYALSGRQFPGLCTKTVRPTAPGWGCRHISALPQMLARGMQLDSWMAATNGGACGDGGITLGTYPVRSVDIVKIDGQVLDPSAYRVDDQRWLVRPGKIFWPVWQRLDLPDTENATFSVALSYGADPPDAGIMAASALGAELAKARAGLANRLPQRVNQITRQQVMMTVIDPMTFLTNGMTGIYECDLFIKSVNPQGQTRKPTVWTPEKMRNRRM